MLYMNRESAFVAASAPAVCEEVVDYNVQFVYDHQRRTSSYFRTGIIYGVYTSNTI